MAEIGLMRASGGPEAAAATARVLTFVGYGAARHAGL
jgi:hypothetical protein